LVVRYITDLLKMYLDNDAEKSIKDQRVVPLAREMVKVFKKFNLHLADKNDYVQVAVDSFLKKPLHSIDDFSKKLKGNAGELHKSSKVLSAMETLQDAESFFQNMKTVTYYQDPRFPIAIVLMKIIDVAKFSADDGEGGIGLEETKRRVKKLKYLSVLFAKTKHIPDAHKKQLCDMIDGLIVGGRCRYPKSTKDDTLSKFVSRKLARTVIQDVRQFFVNYITAIQNSSKANDFDDEAVRKLQEVVNRYFVSVGFDYLNRKEMKKQMYTTEDGKDLRKDMEEIGGSGFKGGVFRGVSKMKGAIRGSRKPGGVENRKDIEKGWISNTHEVGQVVQRLSGIQQQLKKDEVMKDIKSRLNLSNKYQINTLMKHLGNTRYSFDQLVRGNRASPEKIADNFINMFDKNKRKKSAFLIDSMFSYSPGSKPEHLSIDRSTDKLKELMGEKHYEEASKPRALTDRSRSRSVDGVAQLKYVTSS